MASLSGCVNAQTQRTREGSVLLFHRTFLGIGSPERHAELQILNKGSRPTRVFMPSLVVSRFGMRAQFVEGNRLPSG